LCITKCRKDIEGNADFQVKQKILDLLKDEQGLSMGVC
jgi:hypothetical protein